jgi:hypothetical protein
MALIQDKKELVQAVQTVVQVDNTIMNLLFPSELFHTTETIEYDASTVEGVAPGYNSFKNRATVVAKDGFDTVTLNPVSYNESISKTAIYANARKFGENVYGATAGMVDPIQRALLDGVAKLELRTQVGKKAIMYEALTTHKIAGGFVDGTGGAVDIVFAVPAANKEVLANTGSNLYWDNASSKPLTNLLRIYRAMKVKPTAIVMNDVEYGYFFANAQVTTIDNTTTGEKRNFYVNEAVDSSSVGFRAGRINYMGMIIDVWVEPQTRLLANGSRTAYLPSKFVIFASNNGEMHYGGIPVAQNGTVENITAPFDIQEIIEANPPVHQITYRAAPLPVLKNGEEYYSLQVRA